VIGVHEITSGLVNCFEIVPHFVGCSAPSCVDLLFWGDVLVNQHAHVGIVKLPVLSALRIKAWIGACDVS